MPVYEYKCDNCGHVFEKIQSMRDEPLIQCPNCSFNSLHKVFYPAGIIFKGSGWYITDSRKASSASPSSTSDTKKESQSETKTESKTEGKTESKAEVKSETKTESKSDSKSSTDSK